MAACSRAGATCAGAAARERRFHLRLHLSHPGLEISLCRCHLARRWPIAAEDLALEHLDLLLCRLQLLLAQPGELDAALVGGERLSSASSPLSMRATIFSSSASAFSKVGSLVTGLLIF